MTLDTPEALEGAKYLQSLIYDNNSAAVAASDQVVDFGAGLTGCTIGSTGSLTGILAAAKFDVGTGYMPVRTSAVEGKTMKAVYAKRPQFRMAVDQLATTRVQDWGRVFVPNGDKDLTTALEKIMLQNGDPAEAFATASASIAKSYEDNVKPYL